MGVILSLFRPRRRGAPTEAWEEVRGTRCVFVGATSGKTQLFRRVLGLTFQTTNLDEYGAFEYKSVRRRDGEELLLLLFDAGNTYDEAPADRTSYLFTLTRGVQIVWVVFDLTKRETLSVLERHMAALKANVSSDAVTALVGNKSDLEGERQVSAKEAQDFVSRHGLHTYLETSARTGSNVPDMFYDLLECHTRQEIHREELHIPTRLRFQWERNNSISSSVSIFPGQSIQETSNDLAPLMASSAASLQSESSLQVGTLVSCTSSFLAQGSNIRDGARRVGSSPPSIRLRADSSALSDLPSYKMSARPRGICVIINNKRFQVAAPTHPPAAGVASPACAPGRAAFEAAGAPSDAELEWLTDRVGSELDADLLKRTFEALHFQVTVLSDLTDVETERQLRLLSLKDHAAFDCFACCLLSHGSLGRIYGVNGGAMKISDMTSHFCARPCPSLAGKPKLFFVQACQGRQHMHGLEVNRHEEFDAPAAGGSDMLIPDEADFLLGYATVPGYAALRNTSKGSWYIVALCETLNEYGSDLDILNVLVKVNKRVSEKVTLVDNELVKQVPAPLFTLTRRLLLST